MKTELYWVEGAWPGRLAFMPRPRGGDWLDDEVRAWRRTGVDAVVSLLTPDEVVDLGLEREEEVCRKEGMDYFSFPIRDRGVPPSRQAVWELTKKLGTMLAQGRSLAIHCRQGIGRAALIAACLLVRSGVGPEEAFRRLSAARGCAVPETAEQRRWVEEFAQDRMVASEAGTNRGTKS